MRGEPLPLPRARPGGGYTQSDVDALHAKYVDALARLCGELEALHRNLLAPPRTPRSPTARRKLVDAARRTVGYGSSSSSS